MPNTQQLPMTYNLPEFPASYGSNNHSLVNQYQEVDFLDFSQNDIDMRSTIFTVFAIHTSRLLGSFIQDIKEEATGVFVGKVNNERIYFTSNPLTTLEEALKNKFLRGIAREAFGFYHYLDFIGYYAETKNKSYKNAVYEIYQHINNNKALYPLGQDKSEKLTQACHPITIKLPTPFDLYFLLSLSKLSQPFAYYNRENNLIGLNFSYKNNAGELINIFYTLWHHPNSPTLYLLPKSPLNNNMAYNIFNAIEFDSIYVSHTEQIVTTYYNKLKTRNYGVMSIPFGIKNLDKVDFEQFAGKTLILDYKEDFYEEDWLKSIIRLAKQSNVKIDFHYKTPCVSGVYPPSYISKGVVSIDEMLKRKEFIISSAKEKNVELRTTKFSNKGEDFIGDNSSKEPILTPIIDKGRIITIFGESKVGKTHFVLTLAYMLSKGNTSLGPWKSISPQELLYVHGEMQGNDLGDIHKRIVKGFDGNIDEKKNYSDYFFSPSERKKYNNIVQDQWKIDHEQSLLGFDVIIFDSYQTLVGELHNTQAFFEFLLELSEKGITVMLIDHTNRNSEVQGSINKERYSDLGLKIEKVDNNQIKILPVFDRYGKSYESESWVFEKVIAKDSFCLEYVKKEEFRNSHNLSSKEKIILYCYLLLDQHKWKQTEISKQTQIRSTDMSNYINSARFCLGKKNSKPDRFRISNKEFFKKEYENIKDNISKEEILEALETYKKQ